MASLRPKAHADEQSWMPLAVDVLATYRLTRLVTADVISEPMRLAFLRRVGGQPPDGAEAPTAQKIVEVIAPPPRLATLITCRWCAGVWIAGGVTVARALAPKPWAVLARGLALSA